ncbi:helix-turn-helix domain-containing protein [Streptomyces sp. NPDC000594]|uniref:helix-turn-helix domain-containing protein n=1 Tax=Streptomyces sp. NPDC000594 TaxID=3154261 RepID=UPI00331CF7D6
MHLDLTVPHELWDRPAMRRALADRDIGAVFRLVRQHTGVSQTRLGAVTGLAQSDVSAIERGARTVTSADVLDRITSGLHIPNGLTTPATAAAGTRPGGTLRFAPTGPADGTRVGPASGPADAEDPVKRRDLVNGALGISAALLTSTPAHATPSGPPTAPLERALFEPPAARPASHADLAQDLTRARAAFSAARYQALGRALPALIATAEATRDHARPGHARDRAHALIARAYVLAAELAVKEASEAVWVTADRALVAARASGDPQVISEAARMVAIAMRRAGQGEEAVGFLTRTALDFDGYRGDPPPAALAAKTCLLLTAGYTAACGGHRTTALDLVGEADQSAHRIPHDQPGHGLFTITASPAQVDLYRIGVHTQLGTPDDGITYAQRVAPARLPTAERKARFHTDTARMWHRIGRPNRVYTHLRAIEHVAPEELRRPSLRTVTTDLLYTRQSQALPGIRAFAARHGALL